MIGSLANLFGHRYTIGELMAVDQGRQERSAGCSVSLVDTFFSLKEESLIQKFRSLFGTTNVKVFYMTLKFNVVSATGSSHTVFIQLEPDFSMKNWGNNQVRIYCSCNDFKYRAAYELGRRGSLFLSDRTKLDLGSAITDAPKSNRGRTTLCKHSHAALSWLMNNYSYIMQSI